MKRFILAISFVSIAAWGFSQPVSGYYLIDNPNAGLNPGSVNSDPEQPLGAGLPTNWTVIHPGNAAFSAWTPIQNIPFPFFFDGKPAFQYKASTSGVVTFSTDANIIPSSTNTALPSVEIPNNSVFVWGLKGNFPDNKIVTKVFGPQGSRQLWISYNGYSYNSGNSICKMYWSIVLEEGTNNIYVVDQRKGFVCIPKLTVGLLINQGDFIQVPGSPAISGQAGDDPTAADNSYYHFVPGEQPRRDIEAKTVDMPTLVEYKDAPVVIKATFSNAGTDALKSFDYNYQINGGPIQSQHFSGPVNLSLLDHGVPWMPNTEGTFTIKVWLGLPNGLPDQRPDNDTLVHKVTVLDRAPIRKVLVEEATQQNCGPCAAVNPAFDAMLQNNFADVAPVKYASHWPGANNDWRRMFNEPHHSAMVSFWEVTGVPTAIVDGAFLQGNPGNINQGTIDQRKNKSGVFEMKFEETVNGSNIDIEVEVTNLIAMDGKDLVLRIAVVQDERMFATPPGTNGETEFFDIMRYMVPSPNGTLLQTNAGAKETVTFSYPIVQQMRNSTIRIVAWVMEGSTKEVYMTDKSSGIYLCNSGSSMTGTISSTDASCLGTDGSVGVFASGGTGALTYLWSNGATTPTLNNVGPGNYTVTVSDAGDCDMKFFAKVNQTPPAKVRLNARQVTCPNEVDGTIDVFVAGGTEPYSFLWNNGSTTQNLTGLAPGNYSVTVTDANGCITPQVGVNVKNATVASINGSSTTPDNGSTNGTATVSATGGTHHYTFTWDNGMTGESITGLAAGDYTVTVTDYYGCPAGTQTVSVDSNVGIEDALEAAGISSLKAFPNPTSGTLRLDVTLQQMDDLSIRMFDVNGRVVYSKMIKAINYNEDLDMSGLSAGVYVLQLQTSQGVARHRVVRDSQ